MNDLKIEKIKLEYLPEPMQWSLDFFCRKS